jgi:outer membrane protein
MTHRFAAFAAAVPAVFLICSSPAAAQEKKDLRVRVGLGPQVRPEFIGAKDHQIGPLVDVDIARGDKPFRFEAPDDSFGLRLVTKDNFTFGPAVNIEGSRKDKDVGASLGKVKTSVEVGGFAEYLPAENIRLRGQLLKGVTGHRKLVGSLGADMIWRDGDRYVFSVGPRVLVSDARYQRAYFGVDTKAALATGLPLYRPDGGVHALALASGLTYQFNPKWGAFGYARYERLVGDAAKSPVVRAFGSRNQMSAGIGLSYTFTVKR